jgi:uncharacterized OsmC-like protein
MPMTALDTPNVVNGLDLDARGGVVRDIAHDPSNAIVSFKVNSAWTGQTRSEATITSYTIGGAAVQRRFTIPFDEPRELLGENAAPNPQEYLMAALNACMLVGYVAAAALEGITLEKLELETTGALDLRGFLGLEDTVRPGHESVAYTVRIKGNATDAQFRRIHETVMKTSPNYFNVSQPIRIDATLEVER